MNSYNTIINELITQKQVLTEKGFAVNTANTYPSPSEITESIRSINFDLSASNATEADVLAGKTFYSKSNELKTGTLTIPSTEELNDYIGALISGRGNFQIMIPDNISHIRPYAFAMLSNKTDSAVFYYENFTIPANITHIYEFAFYNAHLTGTLTIPSTVQEIYSKAFYYSDFSECILSAQLTANATNIFSECSNLKKVIITEPVTTLYKYNFGENRTIGEIVFPATLQTIANGTFYFMQSRPLLRFVGANPPVVGSSTFTDIKNSIMLVPMDYYDAYYNATNYLSSGCYIFAYGNFKMGDSLPTTISDKPVTWHLTHQDAYYNRNAITECPADKDSELVAKFT